MGPRRGGAETGQLDVEAVRQAGFNGAAPGGRGNIVSIAFPAWLWMLQWGRAGGARKGLAAPRAADR